MRPLIGSIITPALLLVIAAGCGHEKDIPKAITISTDSDEVEPASPVPKESHPQALHIVSRAIEVATEGHPARLEKLRVNRVSMKGVVLRYSNSVPVRSPTIRKIAAAWPDRFALWDEYNDDGPVEIRIGLRRPTIWARSRMGGGDYQNVDPTDQAAAATSFAADAVGRHWMALLVPLKEPSTIVYDARKEIVGRQNVDVIRASVPDCPVFTLWFDEKTGHLGRVDFSHKEFSVTNTKSKTFSFGGHRSFSGVVLPSKIDYVENGDLVEEWTVDNWEFPEKPGADAFEPPVE